MVTWILLFAKFYTLELHRHMVPSCFAPCVLFKPLVSGHIWMCSLSDLWLHTIMYLAVSLSPSRGETWGILGGVCYQETIPTYKLLWRGISPSPTPHWHTPYQLLTAWLWILTDGSAGELVNPAKAAVQVNAESMEGKDLYKVSHHDFEVGEMIFFFL